MIHAARLVLFDRAAAAEGGDVIKLAAVYVLAGAGVRRLRGAQRPGPQQPPSGSATPRSGAWSALSFLAGDRLGDLGNGVLVLGLALIAGFGLLGRGQPATTSPEERQALAERFGDRLFIPALTLPLVMAFGVLRAQAAAARRPAAARSQAGDADLAGPGRR